MPHSERRRFSRIPFDYSLVLRQNDQQWSCHLLDISLKGILLTVPNANNLPNKQSLIDAEIQLSEQATITMQLKFVREWEGHWALVCDSIDVDSISHLRRLIELNLGDSSACERELTELMDSNL